jgi:hypothetical protein
MIHERDFRRKETKRVTAQLDRAERSRVTIPLLSPFIRLAREEEGKRRQSRAVRDYHAINPDYEPRMIQRDWSTKRTDGE